MGLMNREIIYIEIKNFRAFHEIKLDFKSGKGNKFISFIGTNRFGKSSMLNAILWCLYGDDAIKYSTENGKHYLKNERYLNEETEVSLMFSDSHILKRTENNFVILKKDTGNKYKSIENPEIYIRNTILPQNISKFFLFKGEFLDSFFEKQNGQALKDTILNVSGIDTLERMKGVLKDLKEKYKDDISKANKNNQDLEYLQKQINIYSKSYEVLESDTNEIDKILTSNSSRISAIDKQLMSRNINKITELMTQEESLKKDLESLNGDIKELRNKVFTKFFNDIAQWFIFGANKKFKKHLEHLVTSGKIPLPAEPNLIEKIFDDGKCICGTKMNPAMKMQLNNLLAKLKEDSPKANQLHRINLLLSVDASKFNNSSKELKNLFEEKSDKEKKIKGISDKLKTVSEGIKGLNKADINRLQTEKEVLEEDIGKQKALRDTKISDMTRAKDMKSKFESDFSKMATKSSKSKSLAEKFQRVIAINEKMSKLIEEISNDILSKLNSNTQRYFKDIFWSNYQYINYNIKIDNSFNVRLMSPEGNDMLGLASTGETKVLALSFMSALSAYYGFDFPLIVDAPFTALDPDIALKVLKTLKELSNSSQILMFTTRQDTNVMQELNKISTNTFILEKDAKDNTTIKKGMANGTR
jgi:DNA sulfur modification protein DndD